MTWRFLHGQQPNVHAAGGHERPEGGIALASYHQHVREHCDVKSVWQGHHDFQFCQLTLVTGARGLESKRGTFAPPPPLHQNISASGF